MFRKLALAVLCTSALLGQASANHHQRRKSANKDGRGKMAYMHYTEQLPITMICIAQQKRAQDGAAMQPLLQLFVIFNTVHAILLLPTAEVPIGENRQLYNSNNNKVKNFQVCIKYPTDAFAVEEEPIDTETYTLFGKYTIVEAGMPGG